MRHSPLPLLAQRLPRAAVGQRIDGNAQKEIDGGIFGEKADADARAIEQNLPKFDGSDPIDWSDCLRFHIVRREAEALLEDLSSC